MKRNNISQDIKDKLIIEVSIMLLKKHQYKSWLSSQSQ